MRCRTDRPIAPGRPASDRSDCPMVGGAIRPSYIVWCNSGCTMSSSQFGDVAPVARPATAAKQLSCTYKSAFWR